MKKLIGVDLDGTLLNDNNHASKENLEAIRLLKNKDVLTAIVTGRTYYEIPEEVRNCESIDYFVYSDGAGVYSKNDKKNILYSVIKKADTVKALKLLKSYDTYIEIYSNGEPVIEQGRFTDETLRYYGVSEIFISEMHTSRNTMVELDEYANSDNCHAELFDVFFHLQKERAECFKVLEKEFPQLELTTSMPTNIEIMNKGISKGNSFKFLCKTLKISPNSTFAVGDSKNDISLFSAVNTGFAVENACNELKALAKQVICSNNENVMAYLNENVF